MEAVTAIFATIGATGGTAAAAGGTAAAGAAATATAGSTLLSTAQILGTAFTALSTIGGGMAANTAAKGEAAYEKFKTKDAQIQADLDAAEIKKKLAITLQRNKVAAAAGGVDLGSVSLEVAQNQVAKDAENELGMVSINKQREMLSGAARARSILAAGRTRLATALLDAGGIAADGAFKVLNRG
jgi:hypothetical protein